MSAEFRDARLKVKRANKHVSDFEVAIDLLKKRLLVTANVNGDSGNEFIKCDFATATDREALDGLPLVLGDAIHNLKCALDYAWLQTLQHLIPSKDWERTKFVSHPSSNELEAALRKLEIDAGAPDFFNLLMGEIQPYDRGDFFIRTIHELDLRDKHRLLIPVFHYSSLGDIYVKDQSGEIHRGGTWGTDAPLPHFVEFARGLHIENPGSASFDVMFQYGDTGRHTRAVDTLRLYSQSVSLVVEKMEALL